MIRCVAIDDEPIALDIIQEHCRRLGGIDLKCFTSPVEGMQCVRQTSPDIVFLDIEMNSHNGIVLARELPQGTCLIFTTAYSQYALDGFNVDAVDFLHKPIFYQRFERAIEKARKFMGNHEDVADQSAAMVITLRADHKNVIVDIKDIIVVEAMDNYVKVFRRGLPTIITQITMKEMEAMLPTDSFMRVHRSYIVSIGNIEKYTNRVIYLQNWSHAVPVGRKYMKIFSNINERIKQNQKTLDK